MELLIDGKNILGNPVKFDDIVAGDTIIHTIEDENGIAEFWVGEVSESFQDEWWGPYRTYHAAPFKSDPITQVSPESGSLVVARWHEEEDGHRLFYAA